ncbi:MAG: hypothetical protein EOM67_02235 [Spirochaetia bacterium]|nr:hypothetical protein [Spirochaetia bacterium]
MFFKEIGWVDELGSGVRNIYKYNKIYSGADPEFIEGDVFKTIIPLIPQTREHDSEHDSEHDEIQDNTAKILEFCKDPKTRVEIQEFLDIKSRSYLGQKILSPLIKGGLLKLSISDKPTSKYQKCYSNK